MTATHSDHEAVAVRVARPLMYRGQRREAGETLQVPPADAWQLLSGGRAELAAAERDGATVAAAVRAEVKAALELERRAPPARRPR
jgi:hypothetical protein